MSQLEPKPEYFDLHDADNTCFLCNNPRYYKTVRIEHFDFPFEFKTCECGMVKQVPMPNEHFFEWFFNSDVFFSAKKTDKDFIWGYYDYFKDESSRMATSAYRHRKLGYIFDRATQPLNVMKIGPATGTFLYLAKQKGHNVLGCDVSNRFANYAMEHYDVPIDIGRFEKKGYKDGQFDVVVLFNVIENVPNLEEFIQAIHRTLKPGGYFIFNYVDMHNNLVAKLQGKKYFIYRPPICYIIDRFTVDKMMKKYGFKVKRQHWDIRYMHLEKISTLLHWKWLLRLSKVLGLSNFNFPLYAYPSKIIVAERE